MSKQPQLIEHITRGTLASGLTGLLTLGLSMRYASRRIRLDEQLTHEPPTDEQLGRLENALAVLHGKVARSTKLTALAIDLAQLVSSRLGWEPAETPLSVVQERLSGWRQWLVSCERGDSPDQTAEMGDEGLDVVRKSITAVDAICSWCKALEKQKAEGQPVPVDKAGEVRDGDGEEGCSGSRRVPQ